LSAWLGLARAASGDGDVADRLAHVQRDLFALAARLADPAHRIAERVTKAAISAGDVSRLEGWIDGFDAELPPLRRFILAGGCPAGAALHVARTVCRRAERAMTALGDTAFEPELLQYMNRLSDLLFTMARAVNFRAGVPEIEW
jgi:cob(I)alamin adenosyltransferase